MRRARLITTLAMTAIFSSQGFAQPGLGGGDRPRHGEGAPGPGGFDAPLIDASPEALRSRLEERLRENDRERARLSRAIEALDGGEPAPAVIRTLMQDRSERREMVGEFLSPSPEPVPADELWAFIEENLPELEKKIAPIRSARPEIAERLLDRIGPRVGEVIHAYRRSEVLGDLKLEELRLGIRMLDVTREARGRARREGLGDSDRASLRATLVEMVTTQIDIRERIHRLEIERLQGRVEDLESEFEKRASERDEAIGTIVGRMLEQIESRRGRRGPGAPD